MVAVVKTQMSGNESGGQPGGMHSRDSKLSEASHAHADAVLSSLVPPLKMIMMIIIYFWTVPSKTRTHG